MGLLDGRRASSVSVMENYTAEADKLFAEVEHLRFALEDDNELALSIAKRVRRKSTLLVQAIARHNETLHSQEADKE